MLCSFDVVLTRKEEDPVSQSVSQSASQSSVLVGFLCGCPFHVWVSKLDAVERSLTYPLAGLAMSHGCRSESRSIRDSNGCEPLLGSMISWWSVVVLSNDGMP